MNENQILDDLRELPKPVTRFRILPIVLEVLPYVCFFSALFGESYEFLGYSVFYVFANYLLFSWYFFKASKFKVLDIIIAELGASVLVLGAIGLTFKLESWPYANELIIVSIGLGTMTSLYLMHRYTTKKDDPLEYRFSFKLLSRVFLFTFFMAFIFYRSF